MAIKKWSIYLLILFTPFLLMVAVNETSRMNIDETPHKFQGHIVINSSQKLNDKCTWTCHYNTDFCKSNHVSLNPSWFATTDQAYFGIIHMLESTKNYNLVNVFLFLILIPILMWLLILQILRMQTEIKQLKKQGQ
ncbi:MAG: hypothetical protein ACI8ZM_003952 [Crocinitomix sp.]|jgi:hypothetical protein